ncbi:MAG: phosphoglycerate dehydrogenase [Desulfobacterales bacterium]|nr:phosphoglycerate dehydrogenase [Deltaproteobacteria bacterium]NNL41200.1 phosphoglycerate dehydrogenase [Desulfobacterales bacterium]
MKKITVLIEARPFCIFNDGPMEKLKKEGINIIDMRGSGIDNPKFIDALKDVDVVLCGNDLVVNDAMLGMAPRLKAVAKMGVGLDTIDIKAASSHDAIVFNTPGANNQAVADHTFGLILSLARKIVYCDQSLRDKRWEHTNIMGIEIWQKTIGLIGLGAIGQCVALRAKGFQMKIVACDPFWPEEFADEHGIKKIEMDDLLKTSDIVSLHLPLTEENRGMINTKSLQRMKTTALLINAARGEIVNEKDLYNALKDNVIAGAGLDVFENEPLTNSPLLELDNVVLTPHVAAFTSDAMNNMGTGIANQIIEYAKGNKPAHMVNPDVFDRTKN